MKYNLANDLMFSTVSTALNLGWYKGEETNTEAVRLREESGLLKTPGSSSKSTKYSLEIIHNNLLPLRDNVLITIKYNYNIIVDI